MPTRIKSPKKKSPKSSEKKKKARKQLKRRAQGLLSGARSLLHARKKPEVAQADGQPGLTCILYFHDLDRALHFFTIKLGFDLVHRRESLYGQTGLCEVRYPGVSLLLGPIDGLSPKNKDAFAKHPRGIGVQFVITIRDVDAFYNELKARRVETMDTPTVKPWGTKDFSLVDPIDGYHFTFSQPFLQRSPEFPLG